MDVVNIFQDNFEIFKTNVEKILYEEEGFDILSNFKDDKFIAAYLDMKLIMDGNIQGVKEHWGSKWEDFK